MDKQKIALLVLCFFLIGMAINIAQRQTQTLILARECMAVSAKQDMYIKRWLELDKKTRVKAKKLIARKKK